MLGKCWRKTWITHLNINYFFHRVTDQTVILKWIFMRDGEQKVRMKRTASINWWTNNTKQNSLTTIFEKIQRKNYENSWYYRKKLVQKSSSREIWFICLFISDMMRSMPFMRRVCACNCIKYRTNKRKHRFICYSFNLAYSPMHFGFFGDSF